MSAPYRLTREADVRNTLSETRQRFGPMQHRAYAALLRTALQLVVERPERGGSTPRPAFGPGVRSFPVGLAARRRGAAAHVLFYRADVAGRPGVQVLRVLHERMDPAIHLRLED